MGKIFYELTPALQKIAEEQPVYFVATAADGRVSLSPKSLDSIRFLTPNKLIWFNYNGSGNETASHIKRNPRMTLLFTSFGENPLNIRLFGEAKLLHDGEENWAVYHLLFGNLGGIRQIFEFDFDLVTSACGLSTPHMEVVAARAHELTDKFEKMSGEEIAAYQKSRGNDRDLDGNKTDINFME